MSLKNNSWRLTNNRGGVLTYYISLTIYRQVTISPYIQHKRFTLPWYKLSGTIKTQEERPISCVGDRPNRFEIHYTLANIHRTERVSCP